MRVAAVCVLSFIALSLASAPLAQQAGTGVVAGRIQDVDGGVLPGVTVILDREGTTRRVTSNSSGGYSIADVPPGTYRIEMSLAGFRPFTRADVVVTAAATTTVSVKLPLNMGGSRLAPDGTDATDPALARGVYEVVLAKIYGSAPGDVVVVQTSLVPVLLTRDDWSGPFAAVAELRPTLERAADRAPVLLRREAFPVGVKLVTAVEREQRKTSVTPVFFTADGRRAVVYFEHYCGNLCAEGTMVWLTRTDAGVWQIGGSRTFWVS